MKSILIVDDQQDERAIQRALLEHRGYRVDEAVDGVDALDRIRKTPPDLVLLDVAMPRLDGISVYRALRESAETASLPVIFYTASPTEDWKEEVESLGPAQVLIKPVDPHDVASAVQKMIGDGIAPLVEE